MPDVFTRQKRSEVMARIRGRGNRETELALRSLLRANGITGWRRHYAILGRPDFAFPRERVAVFVDGCFWHRCPACSNLPASNREFWERKLSANVERDRRVTRVLRGQGWRVVRVWEHAMRKPSRTVSRIRAALRLSPGTP
jgi:DNA mismatch endonuclease (patch repair protein)